MKRKEGDFDCVASVRAIRDELDAMFSTMTREERLAYFAEVSRTSEYRLAAIANRTKLTTNH